MKRNYKKKKDNLVTRLKLAKILKENLRMQRIFYNNMNHKS